MYSGDDNGHLKFVLAIGKRLASRFPIANTNSAASLSQNSLVLEGWGHSSRRFLVCTLRARRATRHP